MTQEIFIKHIAMMVTVFGAKLQQDVQTIYWNVLKNMSDNDFERACNEIYKTFRPSGACQFPPPSEFFKCAGDNHEDKARIAIDLVKQAIGRVGPYRSVDFGDPALHATIRGFGGWVSMCNWTDEDWNINEGRFSASYRANRSAGIAGPEYVAGISDTHNSAIGKSSNCDIPVCVGYSGGKIAMQISDKKYKALEIESKSDNERLLEDLSNKFTMPV